MARRKHSDIQLLLSLPWYVLTAIGVIAWIMAPSIATSLLTVSPALARLHDTLIVTLRLLSIGAMGVATASWLRGHRLDRQFAAQRSLADLRTLTWQQFEVMVGEAFRRLGYKVRETGQGGADGGVDLVLSQGGQQLLVQCKQYRASSVGVMTVREIYGVMAARQAAGVIVITTGSFTKDALAFARNQPIQLIDGAGLESLLHDIHTPRSASSSAMSAPACPECAATMVLRTARRGEQFWGCIMFPKCRGTRRQVGKCVAKSVAN